MRLHFSHPRRRRVSGVGGRHTNAIDEEVLALFKHHSSVAEPYREPAVERDPERRVAAPPRCFAKLVRVHEARYV